MHTIETLAVVTPDHQLLVRGSVPDDVIPGEHVILVTFDPVSKPPSRGADLFRPPFPIGVIRDDITFRREDLYEDADR